MTTASLRTHSTLPATAERPHTEYPPQQARSDDLQGDEFQPPPDPSPGVGVPSHDPPGHVAGDQAPVVLFTADQGLSRRVEYLGAGVGVDVRTIAQPQRLHPPPQLMLFGFDAVMAMARQLGLEDHDPFREIGPERLVAVASGDFPPDVWAKSAELGIEMTAVLPTDEKWLVSRMLAAVMGQVPVGGCVVGVTGGRGGAGASVLAAALARAAAAAGLRCVLVDADPLGGGSDLLLGAEDEPGLRWPDLEGARGVLDSGDLIDRLARVDGVHVVSCNRRRAEPVPAEAMRAVVDAAIRMADLVVIDIPRVLDQAATVAVQACRTVLLVVPAEVQAAASASRSADVLRPWVDDLRLVVRGPSPGGVSPQAIADALELPLAGWLRPDRGLAAALDRGEPPGLRKRGPLAGFCRDMVAELVTSHAAGGGSRRQRGAS